MPVPILWRNASACNDGVITTALIVLLVTAGTLQKWKTTGMYRKIQWRSGTSEPVYPIALLQ